MNITNLCSHIERSEGTNEIAMCVKTRPSPPSKTHTNSEAEEMAALILLHNKTGRGKRIICGSSDTFWITCFVLH